MLGQNSALRKSQNSARKILRVEERWSSASRPPSTSRLAASSSAPTVTPRRSSAAARRARCSLLDPLHRPLPPGVQMLLVPSNMMTDHFEAHICVPCPPLLLARCRQLVFPPPKPRGRLSMPPPSSSHCGTSAQKPGGRLSMPPPSHCGASDRRRPPNIRTSGSVAKASASPPLSIA